MDFLITLGEPSPKVPGPGTARWGHGLSAPTEHQYCHGMLLIEQDCAVWPADDPLGQVHPAEPLRQVQGSLQAAEPCRQMRGYLHCNPPGRW